MKRNTNGRILKLAKNWYSTFLFDNRMEKEYIDKTFSDGPSKDRYLLKLLGTKACEVIDKYCNINNYDLTEYNYEDLLSSKDPNRRSDKEKKIAEKKRIEMEKELDPLIHSDIFDERIKKATDENGMIKGKVVDDYFRFMEQPQFEPWVVDEALKDEELLQLAEKHNSKLREYEKLMEEEEKRKKEIKHTVNNKLDDFFTFAKKKKDRISEIVDFDIEDESISKEDIKTKLYNIMWNVGRICKKMDDSELYNLVYEKEGKFEKVWFILNGLFEKCATMLYSEEIYKNLGYNNNWKGSWIFIEDPDNDDNRS